MILLDYTTLVVSYGLHTPLLLVLSLISAGLEDNTCLVFSILFIYCLAFFFSWCFDSSIFPCRFSFPSRYERESTINNNIILRVYT